MSKKIKKQIRLVIPTIYIIEANTKVGIYYKVGFTDLDNTSRPDGLIKEYKELHPENNFKLLATIKLPLLHKTKYFNDNKVRDELYILNFTEIKAVNPNFIAQTIGVDGKNEFIEVLNKNINIIDAVNKAIESLKKNDANYIYDIRNILVYNNDQTHKITGQLITNIEEYIGYKIAEKHQNNNLLFIGQPDPQWLATVALINSVVCLTDDADERPLFNYPALNSVITYANNIEEIIAMKVHFNLIINNPPYGSTGANITDIIRQKIDYDEFINLLPANDYKLNNTKDLFNYQSDMKCVTKTGTSKQDKKFKDATVTTHLARIHKTAVNNMTVDEYEISNYIDKSLDKYFLSNLQRTPNGAIKNSISWIYFNSNLENTRTVLLDHRFIGHKHLAYGKDTAEYKWNVLKSIDLHWLKINSNSPSTPGKLNKYTITFDTAEEKDNFVEFIYSDLGFKFISKIAIACNGDSTKPLYYLLPNVDWTRPWTVETLLRENYNYTEQEIQEVIDNLKRIRGFDR